MIAIADLRAASREKQALAGYSLRMVRFALCLVSFVCVAAACGPQDGGPEVPPASQADAGAPEAEPGGSDTDLGGTPTGTESIELICGELLEKVCGAPEAASCDQDSACAAASLLATYEPESCAAALQNERTYPTCGYSACDQLVAKVCGAVSGEGACADQAGCAPALRLRDRLNLDAGVDLLDETLRSCAAALEDGTVFPACEGTSEP